MTKVVMFPVMTPKKLGAARAKKKRRPDPEEMGQLNLFDQSKLVALSRPVNFFEEALAMDEQGDSRAEETYLMAIRHKQSVADAYCNLGIMLADRDEPAQAVNYFTSCLRENPRHFEAHYNLANLYSDKGSLELAQLHYEITIGLEPEFPNSHYNLGLVQISMKKYREAVESIRSYARLATDYDHKAVNELIKTLTSIAQ